MCDWTDLCMSEVMCMHVRGLLPVEAWLDPSLPCCLLVFRWLIVDATCVPRFEYVCSGLRLSRGTCHLSPYSISTACTLACIYLLSCQKLSQFQRLERSFSVSWSISPACISMVLLQQRELLPS